MLLLIAYFAQLCVLTSPFALGLLYVAKVLELWMLRSVLDCVGYHVDEPLNAICLEVQSLALSCFKITV